MGQSCYADFVGDIFAKDYPFGRCIVYGFILELKGVLLANISYLLYGNTKEIVQGVTKIWVVN